MSSSGSQADETKPMYHSNHSYLFSEIIKRDPTLTNNQLEKEFKAKVEGAYAAKLLDQEGAFYHIAPNQIDAFKSFVADEMMWARYLCEEPEGGLTQEQSSDLVAKFQAKIAELKEKHAAEKEKWEGVAFHDDMWQFYTEQKNELKKEHAEEKKKLESEHAAEKDKLKKEHAAEKNKLKKEHAEEQKTIKSEHEKVCQYYRDQIDKLKEDKKKLEEANAADFSAFTQHFFQPYETQIKELWTQNMRLIEENAEVKRQKKNLERHDGVHYEEFQELLAENPALQADIRRKDRIIESIKKEAAAWKRHFKELQKNSGPDEWYMRRKMAKLEKNNEVLRKRIEAIMSEGTKLLNEFEEEKLAKGNTE